MQTAACPRAFSRQNPRNANRGERGLFRPRGEWRRRRYVAPSAGWPLESPLGLYERDDAVEALALLEVGHDEWPRAAHVSRIGVHFFQGGADMRCKVDL